MNEGAKPAMVLNRPVALGRIGGDEELLREIARLFLSEYPALIQEIRSAIDSGDAHMLERSAHSLKGSVANFEACAAVAAAYRLEIIGRSKQLDQACAALAELESAFESLHPALVHLSEE
jgi:two-component system, sensor histidine kinase and response regulator